jgi:hypothetical protein
MSGKNIALLFFVVVITVTTSLFAWWLKSPVINAGRLEKVMESPAGHTDRQLCRSFDISESEFQLFFRIALPVLQHEIHDYSWHPCYVKSVQGDVEYRIRLGGLGEIWQGGELKRIYHCRSTKCESMFAFSSPRDFDN